MPARPLPRERGCRAGPAQRSPSADQDSGRRERASPSGGPVLPRRIRPPCRGAGHHAVRLRLLRRRLARLHRSRPRAAHHQACVISSLRDNALIIVGRSYAEINAALLAACNAASLAESGSPFAASWGCAVKAFSVDTAYRAVSELALLAGAGSFIAGSANAKAIRDLNALLYADGIHDSLYRAAGRALTAPVAAAHVPPQRSAVLPSAGQQVM